MLWESLWGPHGEMYKSLPTMMWEGLERLWDVV